jgi:hypothetical protein
VLKTPAPKPDDIQLPSTNIIHEQAELSLEKIFVTGADPQVRARPLESYRLIWRDKLPARLA